MSTNDQTPAGQTEAADIPAFISAKEAAPLLLHAARQIKAYGMRDFQAKIWYEYADEWTVRINFLVPRFKPWLNWLSLFKMDETGFCVTGHSGGPGDRGLLDLCDGIKGRPAYAVWSSLYCEYLWAGRNFADGLTRIRAIR